MSMPSGLVQTNGLTAYVFPASQLGVFARPVDATKATPIAPSEILSMTSALAALNGVAYDTCGSEPEATAVCEIPVFAVFDAARGVSFAGSRPDTSVTFSVVNGQVQITQGSTVAVGASVAVQGWFTLISNGQVVAPNGGNLVNTDWRAALVVLDTATMAIVIARMDMVGFANAIATYLGATDAIAMDGGGSTALVVPQNTYGAGVNRRIPTWIVVNPGVGTASDSGTILLSLAIAVLAGVGIYLATKPTARKNPSRRKLRR